MKRLILFSLLFIGIASALSAQTKVTRVSRVFDPKCTSAKFGDVIKVWTDTQIPPTERNKYLLYINGVPFKGITANSIALVDGGLLFQIEKAPIDSDAWKAVYQWPYMNSDSSSVTIGTPTAPPLVDVFHKFNMQLVQKCMMWLPLTLVGLLLVLIFVLGARTGLLRDGMVKDTMFSLARTQLAFWTFIIIGSYIYIWLLTGDIPGLTASVTTLLAICAAGTAGAVIVDRSNAMQPMAKPPATGLAKIEAFFIDILTETEGVSMHRLQIVLFTMVFGGAFIQDVIHHLTMPQFDSSTLWLMGISTAGYVGLKQTELSSANAKNPPATTVSPDSSIPPQPPASTDANPGEADVPPVG